MDEADWERVYMGVGVMDLTAVFSKDAVFLTCWGGVTMGGVEWRDVIVAVVVPVVMVVVVAVTTVGVAGSFGRTAGERAGGGGGGGRTPLPAPDVPVGTNSLANGFGWKPGESFLVVVGDEVPESGREDGASREDMGLDIVGGYGYITWGGGGYIGAEYV